MPLLSPVLEWLVLESVEQIQHNFVDAIRDVLLTVEETEVLVRGDELTFDTTGKTPSDQSLCCSDVSTRRVLGVRTGRANHHIRQEAPSDACLIKLINELLSSFCEAIELFVVLIDCLEHREVQS